MPEEAARKEIATATASTNIVKAETTSTSMGSVQRITPSQGRTVRNPYH